MGNISIGMSNTLIRINMHGYEHFCYMEIFLTSRYGHLSLKNASLLGSSKANNSVIINHIQDSSEVRLLLTRGCDNEVRVQSAFTCSNLIIETVEQGVKYVQS